MHRALSPRRHVDPAAAPLLTRTSSYPCSPAMPAFTRLAASTPTVQLSLDALLPLTDRILVSFILFALYAPHPIAIDPFKSVLFVTFVKELEKALAVAGSGSGSVAPNEPLVWVFWKILTGDGDDICPSSPSALARSLLPLNFRARKLILDDPQDDLTYPYDTAPASDVDALGERMITPEEGARGEGDRLLLAARARVLSLAEQRQLTPLLPKLAGTAFLVPRDLAPLAAHNPALAAPLVAALLSSSASVPSISPSASASATSASASSPPAPPRVRGRITSSYLEGAQRIKKIRT
ncbi:hypothetical protein FB451DRAFT_1395027 [Mycena latifolia]|nr:hypothetical protein FB451DRAFT_1395027 [Mycena latifolia]